MVFEIALYLLFPTLALWLARRFAIVRTVGAVTVCYIAGMGLANQPVWKLDGQATEAVAGVAIALAIPLMLFSLNIFRWARMAGSTLRAFGAALLAVLSVSFTAGFLFHGTVPWATEMSGMLVGVYTGGTPNMGAVGVSLGVPSEVFVNLNAADIFISAAYLMFLFTIGPRVLSRCLGPYPAGAPDDGATASDHGVRPATLGSRGLGSGVAVLIFCCGAAGYILVPEGYKMATATLVITTLAVLASLVPAIRALPGTYEMGQYALLVFCFATGAMADFNQLITGSMGILVFDTVVIFGTIIVHYLLGALFRVDRDTLVITSVACIMSPAFVGPVAERLGNREIVISGLATGVMGYAVGNYLGIGLAFGLARLLG